METVNPRVPSTLDAAALCKMAGRGQITGALLDVPLAMDNAIDGETSRPASCALATMLAQAAREGSIKAVG